MHYDACVIDEGSDNALDFGRLTWEELTQLLRLAFYQGYTVSVSAKED